MPNDRAPTVPSRAAQIQLHRVRVLIRPSTRAMPTMQKEAVMTMNRLDEIAARAEAASKELDRLAGGNPGTNWRWSIPAQPDRDTDLILSASQMDVPRLVAALRTVENLAAHWATLAPGDQYYARMVHAAIREALGS